MEMDFSRLNPTRVAVGAAASLLLVVSILFLPWYSLTDVPERAAQNAWLCGEGEFSCTGFETFPILRWLLIAAAFAPLILAYILVRGHQLSWAPGEMTMVVGFTAFVLIAYNGIIDMPAPDDGSRSARASTTGYCGRAGRGDRDRRHRLHPLGRERSEKVAQGTRNGLSVAAGALACGVVGVISHDQRSGDKPDRNLALELVRVTEAAALAAARWVGRGDKESADGAAVDAMRLLLDTVPMDGIVVIGEGEKDEAPMLYNGERIGDGSPPRGRHRRRPARGHDADRARDALGARRDRARRARHDVRPRPLRLHGEDRRRARDRRPAQPRRSRSPT